MLRGLLHVFMSGEPEGEVSTEPSSLGAKHWWKFATHSLSNAAQTTVTLKQFTQMFRTKYVPLVERERVREIDIGVYVAQADDIISDGDYQDVHRESFIFPRVCIFGAGSDVPIFEHAQDGDSRVYIDTKVLDPK